MEFLYFLLELTFVLMSKKESRMFSNRTIKMNYNQFYPLFVPLWNLVTMKLLMYSNELGDVKKIQHLARVYNLWSIHLFFTSSFKFLLASNICEVCFNSLLKQNSLLLLIFPFLYILPIIDSCCRFP